MKKVKNFFANIVGAIATALHPSSRPHFRASAAKAKGDTNLQVSRPFGSGAKAYNLFKGVCGRMKAKDRKDFISYGYATVPPTQNMSNRDRAKYSHPALTLKEVVPQVNTASTELAPA